MENKVFHIFRLPLSTGCEQLLYVGHQVGGLLYSDLISYEYSCGDILQKAVGSSDHDSP